MKPAAFNIGDPVEKWTGDYTWPGVVRAVFETSPGGPVRYVVAHPVDRGHVLHIYGPSNLRAAPEQRWVEDRNPDHVYDKSDWEYTSTWDDRDTLTDGMCVGEIIHVGTLFNGPDKWASRIGETEIRWFDTREEAEAALPTTQEKK